MIVGRFVEMYLNFLRTQMLVPPGRGSESSLDDGHLDRKVEANPFRLVWC